MIRKKGKGLRLAVLTAVAGLTLTACGGAGVDDATATAGDSAAEACGTWNIAMHGWVGYTASAQVVAEVAKEVGCTINQTILEEAAVSYDAMEGNSVDLIIEDWGGGRWQEWADRGAVVVVGENGNEGRIGMFVPAWMAEDYPDITDSANLNKYAELFVTKDSKGKGAWYEGPPGYTTIGEKMIEANNLNYTIISTGTEPALIAIFEKAAADRTPALAYFYEPQNFLARVPLARVNFPDNDWTDTAEASGLTDYGSLPLIKLASKKLMDANDPFTRIIKNFKWTNDDQNGVAADIEGGMSPEDAAKKWIAANRSTADSWLK